MNKPHAASYRHPVRVPAIHAAIAHTIAWPVIVGSTQTPAIPRSALKWSTALTSGPTLPPLGTVQRRPLYDPGAILMPPRDSAPPPQTGQTAQIPIQPEPPPTTLGTLRNGNPRGNPNAAPRCGAKTRAGCPCRGPAMKNGKCRMHGGASTGPSAKGRTRIAAARTIHGARGAAARAADRTITAIKRRGPVLIAMAKAGSRVEDLAAPIRQIRATRPAGPPLPRKASKAVRDRCFVLRELTAMDFIGAEVRLLRTAIDALAQKPLHREAMPKPHAARTALPVCQPPVCQPLVCEPLVCEPPVCEPLVCDRPRRPALCRRHQATDPFPPRAAPHAPWGCADLSRLGRDVPHPRGERPNLVLAERQMHPLVRRRLVPKGHARPPFGLGPDGPRAKTPAAIRADVPQLGGHALGAEGALVSADACDRGGRRQIPVAPFAVGAEL